MSDVRSRTPVTEVPPADAHAALAHFESVLGFETDCWDVHAAMASAEPGFVLVDVRTPELFAQGHIAGAINIPRPRLNEGHLKAYPLDTVFVVYCAGSQCNGADKAAAQLARLGRPVKKMSGGLIGWRDDGFDLTAG
jgi:rhodanese-related sulfurtransferase